jgi:hypothetical protein
MSFVYSKQRDGNVGKLCRQPESPFMTQFRRLVSAGRRPKKLEQNNGGISSMPALTLAFILTGGIGLFLDCVEQLGRLFPVSHLVWLVRQAATAGRLVTGG